MYIFVSYPMLASVLSTWHKLDSYGKRDLNGEMPLPDWPAVKPMGHFLDCWLMWVGPAHVGGATPGQVVQSCVRK